MSETTQVEAVAAFGMLLTLALVMTFVYLIPAIITWWKLFKKAGKPGWASIIPVYSSIVMAEIGEKPVWMGVLAGILGLGGGVLPQSARALGSLGSLVGLVFSIMLIIGVAKKFDKGAGFWVAAILLPIVAVFMVDKANYIGGAVASGPAQTPPAAGPAPTPQTPPQV